MFNLTRITKWREYYSYSLGMLLLGIWSLSVSGAIFLALYCIVAALLVAITPLIFRLPIRYRKRVIGLCSYGQLVLAGLCIVLILASIPTSVYAQFLNGAEMKCNQELRLCFKLLEC